MARNQGHRYVTLLNHQKGWQARWIENGRQKQVTLAALGIKTAAQRTRFAKQLSEKLIADRRMALLGLGPSTTEKAPEKPTVALSDAIEARLKPYEGSSLGNQRRALSAFSDWLRQPLAEMTDRDAIAFRDFIESKSWAPATKQLRRQLVSGFLRFAADRGWCSISESACRKLAAKPTQRIAKEVKVIDPEAIRALDAWFQKNDEGWSYAFWRAMVLGGFRIEEVCTLDLDQDLLPECVRLQASNTKTRTSRDVTFDVAPSLGATLRKLKGKAFAGKKNSFLRRLRKAGAEVGVDVGGSHTLRRVAASTILGAELLPLYVASRRQGTGAELLLKSYANLMRGLDTKATTIEGALGLYRPRRTTSSSSTPARCAT